MKFLGWILFFPCFLWALGATYQVWQLKKSPMVLNISPEVQKDDFENLSQVEKISFIRQFVERYTSFDHDNFWQTQAALSFLMAPDLRGQRLEEISRLKNKIRKNLIDQKGTVTSLTKDKNGRFYISAEIDVLEGKTRMHLQANIEMNLQETPRNLDNPWGLLVSDFKVNIKNQSGNTYDGKLSLKMGEPTILAFPCAVENFEIPVKDLFKVKITTFNVSEIQLYALKPELPSIQLKAFCHNREFVFSLDRTDKTDLFANVPNTLGKEKKNTSVKAKKANPYQKTIENELGFVIDE